MNWRAVRVSILLVLLVGLALLLHAVYSWVWTLVLLWLVSLIGQGG